ncbi:thioredoxin family protein [uncultured Phycicoccus sp.]|uniref:thioredoxin family protein n=1 Tax=uncultured Phycicoccus sp. TaxID=661422 RepID=UPI00261A8BE7|nr:thioredoxin family protein [uncultured Phycicoccus sp.]
MEITLLYFGGCPHWEVADQRVRELAAGRPDITITHRLVETPEEADRVGFLGSPSILVDGVDPFAEPGEQPGLSCRRYRTPDGYAGAPTLEQLRAVLGAG